MARVKVIPAAQADALSFDPCWFEAPVERSPLFFPAFVRVSIAVQSALRRAVPPRHFADLQRFRDTRMAYPLLVYAASRPFHGEPRTEFTYDILNRRQMRKFYFSVAHNLPELLREVSERLRAAGMADIAKAYRPDEFRSIIATVDRLKICRRRLEPMLLSETAMVNALIRLAGGGPLSEKDQTAEVLRCEKTWRKRLRRFYARRDYRSIGPEVLAAATEAFMAAMEEQTAAAA